MDCISFIDKSGSEVAFHHGLSRHGIPEPSLDLCIRSTKQLIQTVCFLIIDIRSESQCRNVSSHIITADQLIIDCLYLRLAPILLCYHFHPRQLTTDKANHTAVMHPGYHCSCSIITDRIISRQTKVWIFCICDQFTLWINAIPPV